MRIDHASRSYVGRLCLAGALCGLSLVAQAATTFPGFMATVAGQSTTVATASNGTLLAVKAPGTLVAGGGWQLAGNYGVAAGAAGATKVGADVVVNVGGKNVGTQVAKEISKADIAGAVVGCIGGAVSCAVSVGIPLATAFFSLSGARFTSNGGFEATDPKACLMAPCYSYRGQTAAGNPARLPNWSNTFDGAMEAWRVLWNEKYLPSDNNNYLTDCFQFSALVFKCNSVNYKPNSTTNVATQTRTPDSPTWYPSTPEEVKQRLIAQPTNPNIGIVPELHKAGIDWTGFGWMNPTPPGTIAGPATVTGPAIVTSRPDGSTSTKQETTPLTYSGPKVTAGPKVETVIERNSTGQTTGTTTTTTSPGTEADPPTKAEEPPKDPPLQCDDDKYPNSLGCVELGEPGDGEIPKSSFTLTYLPEVVGGSGTCPADRIGTMVLTGRQYVAWDFQRTCSWISSYVKPVVILLATMAAFLILMPGKVET